MPYRSEIVSVYLNPSSQIMSETGSQDGLTFADTCIVEIAPNIFVFLRDQYLGTIEVLLYRSVATNQNAVLVR